MPNIGIISDIHSNITALDAVLTDMINRFQVQEIWSTGDLVGYYCYPVEVISRIKEYCVKDAVVKGNHDDAAAKGYIAESFRDGAAKGLQWSLYKLSDDDRRWLNALPSMATLLRNNKKIMLVHGSPNFPLEEYVHPKDDAKLLSLIEFMNFLGIDLIFLGHLHKPFIYTQDSKTVVNSGSVGQPRDNDPRASYVILNTETWEITIERVPYDIEFVKKSVLEANLPKILADRLEFGR